MSVQKAVVKSELQALLKNYHPKTGEMYPISLRFFDSISAIVDSIDIQSLEDLKISFHNTNEKLYVEFEPINNYISCKRLEKSFYDSFQLPELGSGKWEKFSEGIDCNPYKLFTGPGGLKLEVENNYDRIKMFRFIIPLQ